MEYADVIITTCEEVTASYVRGYDTDTLKSIEFENSSSRSPPEKSFTEKFVVIHTQTFWRASIMHAFFTSLLITSTV